MEASNVEELLKATGMKNEFLEMAASMVKNQDEIPINGDKLAITYYKNRTKTDTEELVLGTEAESETVDGRKVKVKVTQEGNKLIFAETGPFDCTSTFEVNGDTATSTIVCGGVTAKATLKKV